MLSGFGGSLMSCLSIKTKLSVGASGALFGLLGSMVSELITNWTIYENKVECLSQSGFKTLSFKMVVIIWCYSLFSVWSTSDPDSCNCCQFGYWNLASRGQFCTRRRVHFWIFTWLHPFDSSPIWVDPSWAHPSRIWHPAHKTKIQGVSATSMVISSRHVNNLVKSSTSSYSLK